MRKTFIYLTVNGQLSSVFRKDMTWKKKFSVSNPWYKKFIAVLILLFVKMTSTHASYMETETSKQVTRSYLESHINKPCGRFDNIKASTAINNAKIVHLEKKSHSA